MAESFAATRLQGSGAHALELEGVARHFGALVALTGIDMRIAAGERRAVLGSNGAGKTTLFNAISGDFMPTAGRIRFFGEDITDLPPHERIRRGMRRTYQISQLFRGLNVRDSVFLACRGVSRRRFSLLRPGLPTSTWRRPNRSSARSISAASPTGWWRRSPWPAAAARDRAGARRRAALHPFRRAGRGLSPTERRDLVAILNALPKHIGYIIIEHDLDVALRVSEYVSMMHNGRVFKEGTPQEIEDDPEVQEIYLGGRHG